MKTVLTILLCSFFLIAQENDTTAVKPVVAVVDFDGGDDAKVLADGIRSELVNSGEYTMVSRSDMVKIMEEQQFQLMGMVDEETSVELGKILGAQYLVTGSLSKVGINYFLTAKMINVETSELVASESAKAISVSTLSTTGVPKVAKKLIKKID